MEVGQADLVKSQKNYFMAKWYAHSLAKAKIVYARDQDPTDTIIIRNLYPEIHQNQRIFGLKEESTMKTLFLVMLKLFQMDLKKIQRKIKYVKKEEFEELKQTITLMSNQIEVLGTVVHDLTENEDQVSIRFQAGQNFINVKLSIKTDFPYIKFCNEDKDKNYINSISLFIGESIKLMRYLNTRFNITPTDVLKIKSNMNEEVYNNDSFFNVL